MNELYQNKTKTSAQLFVNVHFFVPSESKPTFDWSNYLVIGLIFAIISIGIVGSFISQLT